MYGYIYVTRIIGESLSPDRVFDFSEDEPKPHPAYDFFTPRPLSSYGGRADVVPAIDEVVEPVAEAEEQMAAPVMDIEEDLAALFGEDDDFENDNDSEGPSSVYKVGGPSTAATEGPCFPHSAPGLPIPPSVIKDLSTRLGSGDGVPDGSCGRQIGACWCSGRGVQQKDAQIQQLQTMVSETSSCCTSHERLCLKESHHLYYYSHLESSISNAQDACNADAPESSGNSNPTATSTNPSANHMETLAVETPIPTVSSLVSTTFLNDSPQLSSDSRIISKRVTSQDDTPSLDNTLTLTNRFKDILGVTTNTDDLNGVEADLGNMEYNISASPTPTFRIHKDHLKSQIIGPVDTPNVWTLVDCPKRVRPIGTKWVLKNKKDERGIVIRNKAILVAQGHTQEDGIYYDESASLYGTIDEEVYVMQPPGFQDPEFPAKVYKVEKAMYGLHQDPRAWYVYQMDVKSASLYGTIDEEVYVMQPPGFQDPEFPAKVYKVEKAMYGLHQDPRAWYGRLSKYLLINGFQRDVRSANTPMDKENPWRKDRTGKDEDLHLYTSMIGSLMYLTTSRPDIMFVVEQAMRGSVKGNHIIYTTFAHFPLLDQQVPTARIETTDEGTIILATVDDKPASHIRDDSQGEACPTDSGLEAEQDRANITKTSTLPSDSTLKLKAKIKLLEDKDGGADAPSREDVPIKGRRLEIGEEAGIERSTEKGSDDTKKMVNVLTSLDAASVLSSGVQVSVPPVVVVTTVTTPHLRRKGKEKMVESETPKKKKLHEQIDVQMAIQLEEEMERDAQRMNEQIARDAKIARIHVEEELQIMINRLERNNETVAKKGISLEQDNAKKAKTSEEVSEEDLKAMMQLVPVEEVYVEAL
nr:hypothetical protein [Tanacetum cinerariifolium]